MNKINYRPILIKVIQDKASDKDFIELMKKYQDCTIVININKIFKFDPSDKVIDDGCIKLDNKDFTINWGVINMKDDEYEIVTILTGKKRTIQKL